MAKCDTCDDRRTIRQLMNPRIENGATTWDGVEDVPCPKCGNTVNVNDPDGFPSTGVIYVGPERAIFRRTSPNG